MSPKVKDRRKKLTYSEVSMQKYKHSQIKTPKQEAHGEANGGAGVHAHAVRTAQRSKRRQRRKAIRAALRFIVVLVILGALVALFLTFCDPLTGTDKDTKTDAPGSDAVVKSKEITVELDVALVGDVITHPPQFAAAKQADGSYDFSAQFEYVKDIIQDADLAICNFEGTFGGEPYMGYPLFSTPDGLAKTLKDTGFDVVTTANNHMIDKGQAGVIRTIDVLTSAGLMTAGSAKTPEGNKYAVYPVYDKATDTTTKIAILSYTYETTGQGKRSINGMPLADSVKALINSYSNYAIEEDLAPLAQEIANARADGAEIIIVYMHWGNEYERAPNTYQEAAAQILADKGVDLIVGMHPHVIQPTGNVHAADGRTPIVYWSLGNFISNQRVETLGGDRFRYTEQGLIGKVKMKLTRFISDTKKPQESELRSIDAEASYIPCWVDKYYKDGVYQYRVIPLTEGYPRNQSLVLSGHLSKADQALADINKLMDSMQVLPYAKIMKSASPESASQESEAL